MFLYGKNTKKKRKKQHICHFFLQNTRIWTKFSYFCLAKQSLNKV